MASTDILIVMEGMRMEHMLVMEINMDNIAHTLRPTTVMEVVFKLA
jgi:hypothetical protein